MLQPLLGVLITCFLLLKQSQLLLGICQLLLQLVICLSVTLTGP